MIAVGLRSEVQGNEFMARNSPYGSENPLITDAAIAKLGFHHAAALAGVLLFFRKSARP